MTVLTKYMFRQLVFVFLACLVVGVGIFLLVDLFSRMPEMLSARTPIRLILVYFLAKTPLVIAQLLPALYFLSLVLMLSLMRKNREIMALQAGGISKRFVLLSLVFAGVFFAVLQFGFSQLIAIHGERTANAIWNNHVKMRNTENKPITDIWIRKGNRIGYLKTFWPTTNKGERASIYFLHQDDHTLDRILQAESFFIDGQTWHLRDVTESRPSAFTTQFFEKRTIDVQQDITAITKTFEKKDDGTSMDPVSLPVWELGAYIKELKSTGSNVERLLTSWHMKWAFAMSMLVLSVCAFSIIEKTTKFYSSLLTCIFCLFVFFILFIAGSSAGQNGTLPAWLGAWGANMVLAGGMAVERLVSISRS